MPPKTKSGGAGGDSDELIFPVAGFLLTGAYYFLSAQQIINNAFVIEKEVRHMSGIMYMSDVSFNLITSAVSSLSSNSEGSKKKEKKKKTAAAAKASKPLASWPRMCLYCLPVFDFTALILTFEAIRMAGSGFQQTVGGASIPISCALNMLITGKRYSSGQALGIGLVIAGLAVKAKALLDGDMGFPLVPFVYVLICNVCYGEEDERNETLRNETKRKNTTDGGRKRKRKRGGAGRAAERVRTQDIIKWSMIESTGAMNGSPRGGSRHASSFSHHRPIHKTFSSDLVSRRWRHILSLSLSLCVCVCLLFRFPVSAGRFPFGDGAIR